MKLGPQLILLLILSLLLFACTEQMAPAPTLPTPTPAPEPAANLAAPDPARGQQVYLDKQCAPCHSTQAEGGIGPVLAGTELPFDQFLHKVRTALPPKPAFREIELTTQDAYHIYGWLESLEQSGLASVKQPVPLPPGQTLGMKVWTEGQCDSCHGAFAQGSPAGPTLAGLTFPFEMERAKMRQLVETIPEHAPQHMGDALFQRLYRWLQAGADPEGGC